MPNGYTLTARVITLPLLRKTISQDAVSKNPSSQTNSDSIKPDSNQPDLGAEESIGTDSSQPSSNRQDSNKTGGDETSPAAKNSASHDGQSKEQRSHRFDLRTIYETSGLLSGSLDLDFIANNLLLSAMSKLLAMRGALWMTVDGSSDTFQLKSQKGCRELPEFITARVDFDLDKILVGDEIPDEFGAGRLQLVAPIAFDSSLLGILGLGGSVRPSGFSPQEIEFVSSLVNMTSAAFQNSITVEQLRTTNRELDSNVQQLNTLFGLSQDFNATVDRKRLVRLLTLSLMGQMMVSKHVFLLSPQSDAANPDSDGERIDVVSAKGVQESSLPIEVRRCLLTLVDQFSLVANSNCDEMTDECRTVCEWMKTENIGHIIPIKRQEVTAGALCLGPKMTGQPYSDGDLEFVSALGNLASVSITNSMLVEEQMEKERLEQEMKLAREIQEGLQPAAVPTVKGIDIAYVAVPSRLVAGDYLDIIELPPGNRTMFAVGDVTGKGMPASLLMSNVQACLHVLLPMDLDLEEATSHINRVITRNTSFDKFITFFYGTLETDTRMFKYVNAGHNPPMLVHADGKDEELEAGGLLLGVMAGAPYESGTLQLQPGDALAMFTDGVTEAMSIDEEEYGEPRLLGVLHKHRSGSAQEIMDAVLADIDVFTEGVDVLSDDLTMIIVKVDEAE